MTAELKASRKAYATDLTDLTDQQWGDQRAIDSAGEAGRAASRSRFARGHEFDPLSEADGLSVGHVAA